MKITINNHEYNFELNGTVGVLSLASDLLGIDELKIAGESANMSHIMGVYYAAFYASNENEKDMPSLMQFKASMTTPLFTSMSEYFWKRWQQLEGKSTDKEEETTDTKNE